MRRCCPKNRNKKELTSAALKFGRFWRNIRTNKTSTMQTAQMLKTAKETRAAALDKAKALGEQIQNRTWNEDADGPALEAAQTDLQNAEKEVARLESLLEIEARSISWQSTSTTAAPTNVNYIKATGDSEQRAKQNYSFRNAIMAAANNMRLEGLEAEMHQEAEREM